MISVLTPTYNRSYILMNAYESLCSQTNKDFEWVIVDDGSTDDTLLMVESWMKQTNGFKIRYFKQPNGGKHRAVNLGVSKSEGEYILILDSDDYLTSDAIAFFSSHLREVAEENFAGISGLKGWIERPGAVGNQENDDSFVDATNIERTRKGLAGDKAEVYKRDILLKYPFPEFEGENFLRESASWDRIALDGYKIRWYNHVVYKCKYLDDGLTKNNNIEMSIKNYQGFTYCTRLSLKTAVFPYNLIKIGQFEEVARVTGCSNSEICRTLNIGYMKLITGILFFKARGMIRTISNNFKS